jgi:hypothetical protein
VVLIVLGACAADEAASTAVETPGASPDFVVSAPLPVVYERLRTQIENCKVIHNLLMPAWLAGGVESDGGRGRLTVVRGSRQSARLLWGAHLEAVEGGTRVAAFANEGSSMSTSRLYYLTRSWAEGTYRAGPFTDC